MTGAPALPLVLPESPSAIAELSWEQIKAQYDTLAEAPLDHTTADGWLGRWSRLEELITEAASLAMIAYTCDTADPAKEAAHLRFSAELMPKVEESGIRLARKLVASGLEPAGLDVTLERFRTSIAMFREENVPLFTQLEQLGTAYQRLTGGMTAEWDGDRQPLPRLAPYLQSPDRSVRERAFRATVEPYVNARDQMADIFDRMLALRQEAARHAGFADFRDYAFPAKFRFDYHPADCLRFHDAVEDVVVPAVRRVLEERRARLGLDTLRPWDLGVNPYRATPIRPYQDPADLPRIAQRILARLDQGLGRQFQTMMAEGLLDLESRTGKAPGGYCDTLHASGRPFIFMNASGVMDDVMTLLHEAGHAFHAFAAHQQPMVWQRHAGSEAAELASMSMELLAARHLAQPVGYLEEEDARRARLEHLEGILGSLAHIASVDAFQHWIYTAPDGLEAEARDAAWVRVRGRFETGVDWSGLDRERVARWYRQLHIFLYPFYYIEYGIAQLGALQVWRHSLADPHQAIGAYRRFLTLGATRRLPELYGAAGAALVFDRDRIRDLVALVEEEAATLRAGLPPGEVASR
jgi:oligoendopeptidase F